MIEIDYCPQPFQVDFHLDKSRFKIVAGGRRVGKSYSCLHEGIAKCLSHRNQTVWWVSPTLTDAREVGWEELKRHLPELEIGIKYMNETRMIIAFKNESRFLFKGAEKERSLRGRGLDHVILDEAAYVHPDIWRKALRPALSDKNGTGTLVSTTNGRNWFWDTYNKAQDSFRNWNRYHWPTTLSLLISKDEIEEAKVDLSEIDFRQEYLAEFITRAGMVYDDFSDSNIISSFKIEDYHDIYLGADFGYANPSAICFMAVDMRTETVIQFDEIYLSRTDISTLSDRIEEKLIEWNIPKSRVVRIYTDPAGNAEELTSGISPVDYLRMERGWPVDNKASLIVYGLHLVRSYIRNASGERRFFVLDRCTNTIQSLLGYSYITQRVSEEIKEEPLKDGVYDHMCDAIRYFFVNRFDKSKWVSKEVNMNNYLQNTKIQPLLFKKCSMCKLPFPSRAPIGSPPHTCNKCKEIENANQLSN